MSSVTPFNNDRGINTNRDLAQVLSSKIQQYKSNHPKKQSLGVYLNYFR